MKLPDKHSIDWNFTVLWICFFYIFEVNLPEFWEMRMVAAYPGSHVEFRAQNFAAG